MTIQSPSAQRCLVTAIAAAAGRAGDFGTPLPIATALPAMRRGEIARAAVAVDVPPAFVLLVESEASVAIRAAGALAELRGLALTAYQPGGDGDEDLQPARAIRRALADGQMSAHEIDYVCVDARDARPPDRAMHAATRGLGRFAPAARLELGGQAAARGIIAIALGHAAGAALLDAADPPVRALTNEMRATLRQHRVGGAVALVIDPAAASLALAFSRPR